MNVEPRSIQVAIVAGCVASIAAGLFFLSSAFSQAKKWKSDDSLQRMAMVLGVGVLLAVYSLWFYRAQAGHLRTREKKIYAYRDHAVSDGLSAAKKLVDRETEMTKPGEGINVEYYLWLAFDKDHGERLSEKVALGKLAAEVSDSDLTYVHREYIIVSIGSAVCALIGASFEILALRMWSTSENAR